jgi:hypothetical protein
MKQRIKEINIIQKKKKETNLTKLTRTLRIKSAGSRHENSSGVDVNLLFGFPSHPLASTHIKIPFLSERIPSVGRTRSVFLK